MTTADQDSGSRRGGRRDALNRLAATQDPRSTSRQRPKIRVRRAGSDPSPRLTDRQRPKIRAQRTGGAPGIPRTLRVERKHDDPQVSGPAAPRASRTPGEIERKSRRPDSRRKVTVADEKSGRAQPCLIRANRPRRSPVPAPAAGRAAVAIEPVAAAETEPRRADRDRVMPWLPAAAGHGRLLWSPGDLNP
jgi:hypothetical protein